MHEPSKKKEPTPDDKKEESNPDKPMETAKVVVKQSGEKVDKKKSFNYESIIEITLPQPQQQIVQQLPMIPADTTREKSGVEERLEEPIKPIISTPKQSKVPQQSNKDLSPSSGGGNSNNESFVSNKQAPIMEWDSFIPVSAHAVAMHDLFIKIYNFIYRALKAK